jgi:hypothetical protein
LSSNGGYHADQTFVFKSSVVGQVFDSGEPGGTAAGSFSRTSFEPVAAFTNSSERAPDWMSALPACSATPIAARGPNQPPVCVAASPLIRSGSAERMRQRIRVCCRR